MAWLDSSWSTRIPVFVDKLSAGVSTEDLTFTVPVEMSVFWDNVESTGFDIRVTDADGTTALTWQRQSFTKASFTCVLEVDDWTPPLADSMAQIWIYTGNSGASDTSGSFTAASARTGHLTALKPCGRVLTWSPPTPGVTKPPLQVSVSTLEDARPWIDVSAGLCNLDRKSQGRLEGEEILWVTQEIHSSGSDTSARYNETTMRRFDRGFIRLHIESDQLTSGTDYTLSLKVGTTEGRILNPRVLIRCQDVAET